MAKKMLSEQKLKEIEEIAAGWRKLLARESFPGSAPYVNETRCS